MKNADEYDRLLAEERCGLTPDNIASYANGGVDSFVYPNGDKVELEPASLVNWPVQLALVNPAESWLKGASLLIAADCTAYVYSAFHQRLLPGNVLLIGCPRLGDCELYRRKLTEIFKRDCPSSIAVSCIKVPFCEKLAALTEQALTASGLKREIKLIEVSPAGNFMEVREVKEKQ